MNATVKEPYARMLFLPSVDNHGETINIVGVSRAEAESLAEWHAALVKTKRKTHENAAGIEALDFLEGNLELETLADSETLADLVRQLSTSEIPGKRGTRAVYIDVDNDTIAVGTTVIYNQNRAMSGVLDDTLIGTVLDAISEAA